jgi:hypothetical protein
MGHVVTLWSLTPESRFWFRFISYKIFSLHYHRDRVFSVCFGFPLLVSFCQRSTLNFVQLLPLPQGQMDKAWKLSIKQRSFGNRRAIICFLCNRRHSNLEAQVQFRTSLCGYYSKLTALQQVSLQVHRFSPAIIVPPVLHTHLVTSITRKTKGRSLVTVKKQYTSLQSGNSG